MNRICKHKYKLFNYNENIELICRDDDDLAESKFKELVMVRWCCSYVAGNLYYKKSKTYLYPDGKEASVDYCNSNIAWDGYE